jgi:hypothetical protein
VLLNLVLDRVVERFTARTLPLYGELGYELARWVVVAAVIALAFDLTNLTPYQREVLTAFVRPLSKNEVMRLLQIVEATIPSARGFSEATKQAILDRAKAGIGELEREYAA